MKLTKAQLVEAAATIYGRMVEGEPEAEIMDHLGFDVETFREARRYMLEIRSEEIRTRPHEHTYVEYLIEQRRNLHDLNTMIKACDSTKHSNALVGAIRLRADIYDRIIERGQEFGFIRKVPERKELVGGLIIADMSASELNLAIAKQLKDIQGMISKHGDTSIDGLDPGPLHYGVPALKAPPIETEGRGLAPKTEGKTSKARTSRRSGGRVRTRE